MENTDRQGKIDLEFPFGSRRLVIQFEGNLLPKLHVANLAPESHGHVYEDVFMTSLPEAILMSTGSDATIDFQMSNFDASLTLNSDRIFLEGQGFQVSILSKLHDITVFTVLQMYCITIQHKMQ